MKCRMCDSEELGANYTYILDATEERVLCENCSYVTYLIVKEMIRNKNRLVGGVD